jgi:hypothetical protein
VVLCTEAGSVKGDWRTSALWASYAALAELVTPPGAYFFRKVFILYELMSYFYGKVLITGVAIYHSY